jgi:hypothetical protein
MDGRRAPRIAFALAWAAPCGKPGHAQSEFASMKTAALIPAFALLVLGGCEQASAPAPDNDSAATVAPLKPAEKDYYADRINALTDKQRDAVLLKAITDAGGECPAVTGSAVQAPVEGHHAWIVHCTAGKDLRALDWVVVLGSGGMMSIVRPGAL